MKLKTLIFAWALATSWFCADNIDAQAINNDISKKIEANIGTTSKQARDTLDFPVEKKSRTIKMQDDLIENITDHEKFIKTPFYKLIEYYWEEKGVKLINEHRLIEINKYRKTKWLPALKTDTTLQKIAQDRAIDRFKNNTCEHWEWENSLNERIKSYWIDTTNYSYIWENLNQNVTCIRDEMQSYIKSPKHEKTLSNPTCNSFWGGVACTDITNTTGKIVFVWNHAYTKCTEEIRLNWCLLIGAKK